MGFIAGLLFRLAIMTARATAMRWASERLLKYARWCWKKSKDKS